LPLGDDVLLYGLKAPDPTEAHLTIDPDAESLTPQAPPAPAGPAPRTPPPVAPLPARERGRRGRPSGLVLVLVVVLVLSLATAGLGWNKARQDDKVDAARRSVTTIAQAYAINLTTYDYATLDRDFARVLDNSTGSFKTQYTQASQTLRDLIAKFKAKATGKVLETAVTSVDGGHAQVLLFVDQTVVNANTKEPRIDRSRMKMGLEKQGRRWLISSLDLV
jgi:Mce-associated membrane protein